MAKKRELRPSKEEFEESAAWGWRSPGESRWPATAAMALAILLQLTVPNRLTFGSKLVIPAIEAVILVVLIAKNPSRLDHLAKDVRWISLTLIIVLTGANLFYLSHLMTQILAGDVSNGKELIRAAVGLWVTNTLAFALWFWELDRGGPIARCQEKRRAPDFLFPQMDVTGAAVRGWVPNFIDYAYVSITNSIAFSPTDAMPLTKAAKGLMGAESLISFATVVVVGARAVNILG